MKTLNRDRRDGDQKVVIFSRFHDLNIKVASLYNLGRLLPPKLVKLIAGVIEATTVFQEPVFAEYKEPRWIESVGRFCTLHEIIAYCALIYTTKARFRHILHDVLDPANVFYTFKYFGSFMREMTFFIFTSADVFYGFDILLVTRWM
jgi:hypothetical protein